MRVAAAWTGDEFVDWKGIAFDGSHQTHTSLVGSKSLVNPVGPGRFEKGERVPMEVKVGNKVLYGKYSGTEVTIDNQPVLILRESDVLAIVS